MPIDLTPLALRQARARLIEASAVLDAIRPMLNSKDNDEVWQPAWEAAYAEALSAAADYVAAVDNSKKK